MNERLFDIFPEKLATIIARIIDFFESKVNGKYLDKWVEWCNKNNGNGIESNGHSTITYHDRIVGENIEITMIYFNLAYRKPTEFCYHIARRSSDKRLKDISKYTPDELYEIIKSVTLKQNLHIEEIQHKNKTTIEDANLNGKIKINKIYKKFERTCGL